MDPESSFELIERAQAGDSSAFNRLLERYRPRLHRWATGRLPRYAREMTLEVRCLPGNASQQSAAQGRKVHDIVAGCVAVPNCKAIGFWGVGDFDAQARWSGTHPNERPPLFDDNYNPKPAYYGMVDALNRR